MSAAPAALQPRYSTDGGEHLFVIEVEADAVAYAKVFECRGFVWLEEIAVHPGHRGRGLARLLLAAVIARFEDQDVELSCSAFTSAWWKEQRPGLDGGQLCAWYGRHGFVLVDGDEVRRMVRHTA